MEMVLGILILVAALFLVVAVLMQSGSSKRLSGSIAGAAETFFGKNKGKTVDKMLGRLTNIVAVVFAVLVLASFLVVNRTAKEESETPDTTAPVEVTTTAAADVTSTDASAVVSTSEASAAVSTTAATAAEQ